jgi:hypothetical protein
MTHESDKPATRDSVDHLRRGAPPDFLPLVELLERVRGVMEPLLQALESLGLRTVT